MVLASNLMVDIFCFTSDFLVYLDGITHVGSEFFTGYVCDPCNLLTKVNSIIKRNF